MMQEESDYWQTVVNTMTDGLMVVDNDRTIVAINKAMEALSGYSKEELIGEPCSTIGCDVCFQLVDGEKVWKCDLFSTGEIYKRRCTFSSKDGRIVHVLKNATLFKNGEGKVIGGVETLTDLSEIIKRDHKIKRLHQALSQKGGFHGIVGRSPAMQRLFDLIQSAAGSDAPVIIYGESGTGKELVASVIHHLGRRKKGPFIRVNCSALSESLLESELFGYVKGAFTGAYGTRKGRFEAADGGDIFLDEIGDLPLSTQIKLLRVLQEKEIERVGDYHPIKIDVRIISATHWDIKDLVAKGRFREDLFYRLHVIPIYLPPLRERMEDIPLLIDSFVDQIQLRTESKIQGISKEVMEGFMRYSWPGNVRELINALEYAFVSCKGECIELEHIPDTIIDDKKKAAVPRTEAAGISERERLIWALDRAEGKKTEAARLLKVSRQTIWKKIKKYGILVEKNVVAE
jgi:two-component system, NtrC family, response regulator HydG